MRLRLRKLFPITVPIGPDRLTRLERQFLPPALEIQHTPPSPVGRAMVWTIALLFTCALVWLCIGEIDVVATAPGKFIPDGKIKVLQVADSATVRAIHVKEGQSVRRGDVLVELDATITRADYDSNVERLSLVLLELARLKAELNGTNADYKVQGARPEQVALQESLRTAHDADARSRLSEAMNTLEGKQMELAAAEDNLRKLENYAKSAREREERVRPHVGLVVTKFDYLKLKDDLSQAENDLAAQGNRVKEAREARWAAQQKIVQLEHERHAQVIADINEKQAQAAELRSNVEKAGQGVQHTILRAPVDGIVQSLSLNTIGGVVTPAQTIATIVPADTPLVIESMVSNEDIGFIKVGQPVQIKVDTFPFQRYGAITGHVAWISPDAEDRQDMSPDASGKVVPNKSAFMYKVRIQPDRLTIRVQGKEQALTAGMTVLADVTTEKRKLIDFLLSPVTKAWDDGVKVR